MNYHNIQHDDMLNGDGLRVTLFVSGCEHRCYGCHNPQTHALSSGIPFDDDAKHEIFNELEKDYISGITFSGGDPLHPKNAPEIGNLITEIRSLYPTKTIWVYTGYKYEDLLNEEKYVNILREIDVLVDGKFYVTQADVNAPWVGSTNQRVIRLR